MDRGAFPKEVEIIIAGAGPAGASLAASLLNKGVSPDRILVVDKATKPKPRNQSRALAIHAKTLELLAAEVDDQDSPLTHKHARTDPQGQIQYGDPVGVSVDEPVARPCPSTTHEIVRRGFLAQSMSMMEKDLSKGKIMEVDMSHLPTRFKHVTSLGQVYTEEIITARLETLGGRIYKGWSVENIEVAGNSIEEEAKTKAEGRPERTEDTATPNRPVAVTLINGDGVTAQVRCCLIVGADGSHSIVREKAGIAFEGGRWNETFLNADVVVRDPTWPFDQISGERNGRRGGMNVVSEHGALMMIPLAGGGVRLAAATGLEEINRSIQEFRRRRAAKDHTITPTTLGTNDADALIDDSQKQDRGGHLVETVELGADKIQTVLDLLGPNVEQDAVTKEKPNDILKIVWTSAYHVAHRIASSMFKADARTVLIGDACHTHSPVGGQGLNAGVVDALQLSNILAPAILNGNLASPKDYPRVEDDLSVWSVARRKKVHAIAKRANTMHQLARTQGKWSTLIRVFVLRIVGNFLGRRMSTVVAGFD